MKGRRIASSSKQWCPRRKGPKRKPACMCDVCTTIHCRFANLRKWKRQSEHTLRKDAAEKLEMNKGSLDLNCHLEPQGHHHTPPHLDYDSMINLLRATLGSMDAHPRQEGGASSSCERQTSGHLSSAVQAMRIVDAEEDDSKPDEVQNDGA